MRPSAEKVVSSVVSTSSEPSNTLYSEIPMLSVEAVHEKLILVDVSSSSSSGPGCEGIPTSRGSPDDTGAAVVGEAVGSSGSEDDIVVGELVGELVSTKVSEGMGEGAVVESLEVAAPVGLADSSVVGDAEGAEGAVVEDRVLSS